MIGASTTTGVATSVYPPARHDRPHLSSSTDRTQRERVESAKGGALASAGAVLSRIFGSTGFIDIEAWFK